MKPTAVFLDRDGTIIEDPGYVGHPDQVRLLPGAAEALRRFSDLGYLVIIVSNQSGVARGLFDEAELTAVHARFEGLLQTAGTRLDGAYYCPYLSGPEAKVEAYRRDSKLRKPAPGMLLQAAGEHHIDLSRSWMIGDSPDDVEAGRRAGCRTILVRPGPAPAGPGVDDPKASRVVGSLPEAADLLEREIKGGQAPLPSPAPTTQGDEVVELLRKIHRQIDLAQRQERQQDFSLRRLFGALLQMFAVVAAIA